jgi:hypothetical protein
MTSINSSPLAARAVICQFNTGAWRVAKKHKGETAAVNQKHGTQDRAKVSVEICDHPALLEIYRLHAEARSEHYRLTLPSNDNGARLLPVARQVEHAKLMADYATRVGQSLHEFVAAYPAERAAAPARLNGLFVEGQWPATAAEVEAKFRFSFRYLPVPTEGQWSEWMADAAAEAQADLREQLAKAVTLVADRLSKPGRTFASLTGNLAELLALVPDLNLSADPQIAALADGAKALLEHDTDTLRDDPIARADTAAKAAELVSLFNLTPSS